MYLRVYPLIVVTQGLGINVTAATNTHAANKTTTPWLYSASDLYWPSYRRLSTKLVLTFADSGVSRSQRGRSPTAVDSVF
jgi:hypothetical protein